MNALDILQPWLVEKGYKFEVREETIVVKLIDPKMTYGHYPRNIRLLEGSSIMIRGNMPEPTTIDLAEPDALGQLEEVLNRQVVAFGQIMNIIRPRSSTNRMPASEAEDEGLTPSGGTRGENDG